MTDTPFLQRIAEAYAQRDPATLASLCFVFPNKRSATFFRHYLRGAVSSDRPWLEPEFTDMSRFVSRFSPLTEATRYESLFTLYRAYCRINAAAIAGSDESAALPFDRFLYWGEMLISDFNDVDRYLVDADSLFVNVERLKEIGSNYLTPEQAEIIQRYWGAESTAQMPGSESFWTHLHRNDSRSATRFRKLWEVLAPLYHSYVADLEGAGLTTRGRLYRHACEATRRGGDSAASAERYVFIGFNVLTTSELKIFRNFKAAGRADFFWDFNSPALRSEVNKAGRFIRKNMEEFPSPAWFEEERVDTFPDIEIIGVPSGVGQAKMAAGVLDRWIASGAVDPAGGGTETAVVLPDESLLIPMIHSMPPAVEEMNITMGFPMRLSPVSALVGNIWTLQKNARRDAAGRVTGYYHEDVRNLLAMPMVQSLDPERAAAINAEIRSRKLFTVDPALITSGAPGFAPFFAPLQRHAPLGEVTAYLGAITAHLEAYARESGDSLTLSFLESHNAAVATLADAMTEFGVEMDAFTFLQLINRSLRGDTVQFSGEPLRGLQVMGMLETRALDFRNLIVTSMNERIFPRRHYTRSFIPDVLRRAYGMATADFQESIFAYYFYRLISRAQRVCLLYDSRVVGGTRSSEMSRYLTQLLYLFPEAGARHVAARFSQSYFGHLPTSVEKTPEVMDRIRRFATPGSGFTLSASSVNTYINCPLLFYLQYVERFNPDEEITDYVDYSTYGSIVHQVMERLYNRLQDSKGTPVTITADYLEQVMKPECAVIDTLIAEAVNNHYHRIPPREAERYRPLVGETKVLATVIRQNIVRLLREEMELTPFTFIAAEKRIEERMIINPELTVNIKQVIDRIDEITAVDRSGNPVQLRRIVDYKTGSDAMSAASVEALFDGTLDNRPKAIMQLLFYCYIYAHHAGYDGPIKPLIYKMRDLYRQGISDLRIGIAGADGSESGRTVTVPLADYRDHAEEFLERFRAVVEEIFDPTRPFVTAASAHACTFCNFKAVCTRPEQ